MNNKHINKIILGGINMSYTNHFGQPQGHALSFVNKIREALIAEIVAINGYENHIANSNMKDINAVWHHIVQDEKDHYGMFLNLVEKYDPEEYQQSLKHRKDNIMVEAMQKYEPEYDKQIILNNIREDIKGEFEAIILYEDHIFKF
jgi:rubrerythrin